MEQKTPLYDCHVARGGKMAPFAGYMLPVRYVGEVAEHLAARTAAGLFDVSHMGEFTLTGKDALANLNKLCTNDFSTMADGGVRYSPMCNEAGGVLDDLLVYRLQAERYLVVVNAANRRRDFEWTRAHLFGAAALEDISDAVAQIALQGPKSRGILARLARAADIPEQYYTFTERRPVAGVICLISQTGYTGDHGYELYCRNSDAPALWNALLEAGQADGLVPCGLGARDTLRLEAAMPLYGHEMDESVSPLETGLAFSVKMGKADFIGKAALTARGEPKIARVGLKVTGRGIAREKQPVLSEGVKIGETTSGTYLPFLRGAYAMALVDRRFTAAGAAVEIDIRGKRTAAEVASLPFYRPKNSRFKRGV
jgi:aminomethyltransferase